MHFTCFVFVFSERTYCTAFPVVYRADSFHNCSLSHTGPFCYTLHFFDCGQREGGVEAEREGEKKASD